MANPDSRGAPVLRGLVLCAVVLGTAADSEELSLLTRRDFDVGEWPTGVAVADFNGDGVLDVVASISTGASVLLGNGDGTFQPARRFDTPSFANAVAVADLNGDGVPDLAIAFVRLLPESIGGLSVLLGNGDGTFQEARNFDAGQYPDAIARQGRRAGPGGGQSSVQ